jgi:hydroxymethylbilane synthase
MVARALRQAHPHLDVHLQVIATEGDRVTTGSLPSWGQGVFVRDIERALLDGRIDVAIHSLKDVPSAIPEGLAIVAVPERADPSDVLVTSDGRSLDELPPGARVGTSSLRRAAFLRAYRPDLDYVPVRGNVDTRWRKLLDPAQGYDALVLASAGLIRLGLDEVPRWPIPTGILLPAPGQGALALEARADDKGVHDLTLAVHDADTEAAVAAEREALGTLEGGCRLPVAALATVQDGRLRLEVAVAAPDGSRVLRHSEEGTGEQCEALGAAAAQALLAQGAAALLEGAVVGVAR